MGEIEIHDGVSNREFTVPDLQGTITIYVNEDRIVVPTGHDVEEQSP